jgi:uncharacterized repeat protein (TIGR03803 family)
MPVARLWRRDTRKTIVSVAVLLSLAASMPLVRAQTFTALYAFTGGVEGAYPSNVIVDSSGSLYGATEKGADLKCDMPFGCGTVFELDTGGQIRVLHTFTGTPDGGHPSNQAALLRGGDGHLYGTAQTGGSANLGIVFRLDLTGKGRILHSFSGPDGATPTAGLVGDSDGNLYGTTDFGGDLTCNNGIGCGTVFKLDSSGNETVLYTFTGPGGVFPQGGVIRDKAGNLYGTTLRGGTAPLGCGTVYEIDPGGHQTVLYSFACGNDGGLPTAGLIRDQAGNLYGTASSFGPNGNAGVVFKLDASESYAVLYAFTGTTDGDGPVGGLVMDSAGNLYGTTWVGGLYAACGTVFKVDRHGREKVLHNFTCGADGGIPYGSLTLDAAGNLYGATTNGGDLSCGVGGCGTVFKITRTYDK